MDFGWLSGDKGQLLLSGALGGVVRWLTLRDKWQDGLISIIVGAICSLYISPLAIPALQPLLGSISVAPESVHSLSGFIIGIGGITVSGMVMDVWRARKKIISDEKEGPK